MTAKRFKLSYPNGAFLIDGDKPLCSIENDLMIVDLLNELAEENKGFKIDGEFKNKAYSKLLDSFMELKKKYQGIKKENKELKKENEQLKKELKRCKDWINSDKYDYELTLAFIKNKGYSLKDVLEYEKELKSE